MSEKKPSDIRISAIAPFGLRMLPELRKQVEEAAAHNDRSMNAEIVARLEASLSAEKRASKERATEIAGQIVQKVLETVEKLRDESTARMAEIEQRNEALMAKLARLTEEVNGRR